MDGDVDEACDRRERAMSQALAKIANMQALLDELLDTVADTRERLDRIEKHDRMKSRVQKFVTEVPINGAQHSGLNGIDWKG